MRRVARRYLDSLGILAQRKHTAFCRQTLTGGNYGLLNTTTQESARPVTVSAPVCAMPGWMLVIDHACALCDPVCVFRPNPDYYALLLFNRLMGQTVLNVTTDAIPGQDFLRAYAHCAPASVRSQAGDVTVLLINVNNATAYDIVLEASGGGGGSWSSLARHEYVMSAPALDSQSVALNGVELHSTPDGNVPPLVPRSVVAHP
jgi:heparanase 1